MAVEGRLEPPRRGQADDRYTPREAPLRISAADSPCGWFAGLPVPFRPAWYHTSQAVIDDLKP